MIGRHLRQFPFANVKPGAWKLFFSTTKVLDKRNDPLIYFTVRVPH